jgi:hypothetical protein
MNEAFIHAMLSSVPKLKRLAVVFAGDTAQFGQYLHWPTT